MASNRRPSEVHRRAISDSPLIVSQARWRPPTRNETGPLAPNRYLEEVLASTPPETVFLSASHAGAEGTQHFGQIPFSGDGGAVVRLRSSRRPDELEIGWTCVPGIDALGEPFTTWEISLRPRHAPGPVMGAAPTAEHARPSRKPSSVSFQSYTMHSSSTQRAQEEEAGVRTHCRGADSAATSPTRSRVRSRFASAGGDSSYGSVSSDVSLWAGPSHRGKMSISTAATSEPEECYSPIDLTAYEVTPDSTPPAPTDCVHRTDRSSSYAPRMAPFMRSRQFSIDHELASKNRSLSLSTLGTISTSRHTTTDDVEGYGEEISMYELAPQPPRRGSQSIKPPATKPDLFRTGPRPSMSIAIDRRPSMWTKSHLPSPLGRPQHDFDAVAADPDMPDTHSTFSGPPLCPLPEVSATSEGKPSPTSRFSAASSLDELAADVETATIHHVKQRPGETCSSRWSDNEDE